MLRAALFLVATAVSPFFCGYALRLRSPLRRQKMAIHQFFTLLAILVSTALEGVAQAAERVAAVQKAKATVQLRGCQAAALESAVSHTATTNHKKEEQGFARLASSQRLLLLLPADAEDRCRHTTP